MKFKFKWEMEYNSYNSWAGGDVTYCRWYDKEIEAETITEAYDKFFEKRDRGVSSWVSIKDENGVEYYDRTVKVIRGYQRPLITDMMVMTKRAGFVVQHSPEGLYNALSGRKIKRYVDIGNGYVVSPADMKDVVLERATAYRHATIPYMTFEEIVAHFRRNEKAGIWRSSRDYTVISDQSNGQSEIGFTDPETVKSLQEFGYLSGNTYGGFKTYYSCYHCIPEGETAPDEVVPLWLQCNRVAHGIAAMTGLPADMFSTEALAVVQHQNGMK
jgi:hypothetical protein